jgi:hypothetical protein
MGIKIMKKVVNPDKVRELINMILTDKIQECEQKQVTLQPESRKSTYYQGAIEMMTELNAQVGMAIDQLNNKE